jgi:hypothetical protein
VRFKIPQPSAPLRSPPHDPLAPHLVLLLDWAHETVASGGSRPLPVVCQMAAPGLLLPRPPVSGGLMNSKGSESGGVEAWVGPGSWGLILLPHPSWDGAVCGTCGGPDGWHYGFYCPEGDGRNVQPRPAHPRDETAHVSTQNDQ